MKKVSIIMTTFNCAKNLDKSLQSILIQDYPSIEIVIVDGGSTDETISTIKKYEILFNMNIKWISEKDKGIYDAMNKGYKMSTGNIILFLNDVFVRKDVVSICIQKMEIENTDGCHSDLIYVQNGNPIRFWKMGVGKIDQGWMPGHPTLFLKREVYEKFGLYKTNYKVSADYEFMIRILYNEKINISYVPEITVQMFYGGTSTLGMSSYWLSLKEAHKALKDNKVKMPLFIDLKRTIKVASQFKSLNKIQLS